jgi:hypothetical protein
MMDVNITEKERKENSNLIQFCFFFSFEPLKLLSFPKIADGLFFLRFRFCAASLKKDFSKTSFKSGSRRGKNEENFIYLGKVFPPSNRVFCVCVNGKMFLLNLSPFSLSLRVQKKKKIPWKNTRHERYVSGREVKYNEG